MRFRIFTEPEQSATYDDTLAVSSIIFCRLCATASAALSPRRGTN